MSAKHRCNTLHKFTTPILFILTMVLSACQPTPQPAAIETVSPTNPQPTETSISPTATMAPQVSVSINGSPFAFNHSPQIIDGILWLPAREIFTLAGRTEISVEEDFLSTLGNNLDQIFSNCHFWIGQTGQNAYSSDTENNIWFESDVAPFMENNEVFLSEKMVEDCAGEFIQFDASQNKVELTLADKTISPLQAGNSSPVSFIQLKNAEELTDTRIGVLVSGVIRNPAEQWIGWAETLKQDGFTQTRITLNASDGPAVTLDIADIEKEIPAEYVDLYRQMKDMGIETRYSLNFWDMEYQLNGGEPSYQRLSSEEEIERYIEYVRMVVTSLKGLVGGYELWNESDANTDWHQRIEPEDFIEVARRVIPLIREIDPDAKIVLPSTSSYMDIPCQEYSKIILSSDVIALADVISLHTVNNDASPVYRSDYYYGYDQMWNDIKALAEAHGFAGEYYADELNYRSEYSLSVLQPEQGEYHPYEPEVAAKYFARMIAINLGMDISVGTSGTDTTGRPAEARMIRNMAYLMEGLKAAPLSVEVNSTSEFIRYYTFENADGDPYIVIWNDVEAKVESEDIEASLVINSGTADSVIAVNPYLLNSQQLVFENTAAGVVIDQLLIKDYPIMIQIDLP